MTEDRHVYLPMPLVRGTPNRLGFINPVKQEQLCAVPGCGKPKWSAVHIRPRGHHLPDQGRTPARQNPDKIVATVDGRWFGKPRVD